MPVERAAARALTLAILATSCHRAEPPEHKAPPAAPAPPPLDAGVTLGPSCPLPKIPLRQKMPARVVAIGDVHGDLGGLRAALRTAGAIDAKDHWVGGALTIVQTGDVLDRGDDEQAMLELLARLADEAPKTGGQVIQLLGNHELMNAAGDFRYVTAAGHDAFGGDRLHALAPGGAWAKQLATHNTIAVIGDTVYSHAGITMDWAMKLDDVNLTDRCWLDGQGRDEPAGATAEDGPVWTRDYGGPHPDCVQVAQALAKVGARRMVVGHTVQPAGISEACDGKLWRIDVGLGKEYGGPIQVLELVADKPPRVLTGTRE